MSDDRELKRIHTTSFLKYFLLDTPQLELPDNYVRSILDSLDNEESSIQDIERIFESLQASQKLKEFFQKLNTVFSGKISMRISKLFLGAIPKWASRFSLSGTDDLYQSEYDYAHHLLMVLLNKLDSDEIVPSIENAISATPDVHLAVEIITSIVKPDSHYGHIKNNLSSEPLKKIKSLCLNKIRQKLITEKLNVIEHYKYPIAYLHILFNWATEWKSAPAWGNRDEVTTYLQPLLSKSVGIFAEFLRNFIESDNPLSNRTSFDMNNLSRLMEPAQLKKLALRFALEFSQNKPSNSMHEKMIRDFIQQNRELEKGES